MGSSTGGSAQLTKKSIDFRHDTLQVIRAFPLNVREVVGRALRRAQYGDKDAQAKPLKGFGGAGVLEICERAPDGTYRVVYTTTIKDSIIVLHAFQKKSMTGIATPKHEMDLVEKRLREAREDYGA